VRWSWSTIRTEPVAALPVKPHAAIAGAPEVGGDRVAKMLARAGVASRREVERLIEAAGWR